MPLEIFSIIMQYLWQSLSDFGHHFNIYVLNMLKNAQVKYAEYAFFMLKIWI